MSGVPAEIVEAEIVESSDPTQEAEKDSEGFAVLTWKRWNDVKYVLSGECNEGADLPYAAKFAGVEVRDIRAWVLRSRKRHDSDEPWIHSIAEFWDNEMNEAQAGRLEGVLWRSAMEEGNVNVAARLLSVRDARYKNEKSSTEVNVSIDANSLEGIFDKLRSASRLASLRDEKEKQKTIDVRANSEDDL